MKLDKQIALITGAASGLGQACADRLAAEGLKVVIWDKQTESIDNPLYALSLPCDVSLEVDVERAMQVTLAEVGTPSICINCAGIAPAQRLVGKKGPMPLFAFRQVLDVNLVGTFNVMRIVADAMIKMPLAQGAEERGVIINTASIAAFEGQIGQIAYSASKGAIVSMTLPAARELAQFAIRVNCIAPGLMATPLLLGMPAEVQENLTATLSYPRRFGKPEEFAALATHIIENSFINGETIRLDAALRMQAS